MQLIYNMLYAKYFGITAITYLYAYMFKKIFLEMLLGVILLRVKLIKMNRHNEALKIIFL